MDQHHSLKLSPEHIFYATFIFEGQIFVEILSFSAMFDIYFIIMINNVEIKQSAVQSICFLRETAFFIIRKHAVCAFTW